MVAEIGGGGGGGGLTLGAYFISTLNFFGGQNYQNVFRGGIMIINMTDLGADKKTKNRRNHRVVTEGGRYRSFNPFSMETRRTLYKLYERFRISYGTG